MPGKAKGFGSRKASKGFRSRTSLVIVCSLVIAVVVWQFYKYKIANRSISKAVTEKSGGLYRIQYENLVIDEVAGALHVKNIDIFPDTAVYDQLVKDKKNPSVLITLHIPALDITGVKTPKALLNKELEGGKVEISNPTIGVELTDFSKDTTVYDPGKDISKELLGKLLKIKVDTVEIDHANVAVRKKGAKDFVFKGDNVSLLLSDLLIDSLSDKDSSRVLFSKGLTAACEEIVLPSKDKKYRLRIEKCKFTSRNNVFAIGRIKVTPQLSEEEFAKSFPKQKDRYDFMLEGIRLVNINRAGLWRKKLEADSLIVSKSSFKIYRDLSYPRDSISKKGKYPQQQLMRLPIPVLIRTAVFDQCFIEYKEKNAKSDSAGKVQFYEVHASIHNITNMKDAISRDNKCVLFFKANFLKEAPVEAKLTMLLGDRRGRFFIDGHIGAIKAVSLNPLTQPMGLARMEKGDIKEVHFDLVGTDSTGSGRLVMLYHGIKISLLKKDKEKNRYDKKGLVSLAANILIKNSNPEGSEPARVVNVHYNRAMNKSFFNLIWKTIFTGVKQSVGIK
jgi:hypothetical protein